MNNRKQIFGWNIAKGLAMVRPSLGPHIRIHIMYKL